MKCALIFILFQAEVNGDLKTTALQQSVNASITKIQMYTCCYNPSRRKETLSQVSISPWM